MSSSGSAAAAATTRNGNGDPMTVVANGFADFDPNAIHYESDFDDTEPV